MFDSEHDCPTAMRERERRFSSHPSGQRCLSRKHSGVLEARFALATVIATEDIRPIEVRGDPSADIRQTDAELVDAFEAGTLGPETFPHVANVRVARFYLLHEPMLIAIARFRAGLQHFAARVGKPDRYHETITVAYMLSIADRIVASSDESWEAFAAANDDLLRSAPSGLDRFYSRETLASVRAREVFVEEAKNLHAG